MSTTPAPQPSQLQGCLEICAIQPELRPDGQTPQEAIRHAVQLMTRAHGQADHKVDLFVFPELSPVGYSEDTFARFLPNTPEKRTIYRHLDDQMAKAAKDLNTHVCYGTIGWHDQESSSSSSSSLDFTIRQIVVDPNGARIALYDKIYPCDFGDCSETRFFVPSPSRQPVSFAIRGFRVGLIICADQRVPTLSRSYAKPPHNVDLILQPAAFYRDVSFPSWKSFRETRAVENSVYFLGVNYAGQDYGETTLVPPWVDETHLPESLEREEGWMTCRIQRSVLDEVRTSFPFYKIAQQE